MALLLYEVNFKARDDAALGRFWAQALGWGVSGEEPGVTGVKPRASPGRTPPSSASMSWPSRNPKR
jgi:hypothetical protein